MLRKFIVLLCLFSFLGFGSGCILHANHPPGRSKQAPKKKKKQSCSPNQYWDGKKCRHKGKGHGARKHDN